MLRACLNCGADISHKRREATSCSLPCKGAIYRKNNPEACAARKQAWKDKNSDRVNAYARAFYTKNPKTMAARRKAYNENNREIARSWSRKYYARKRRATPPWLTSDHRRQLREYKEAARALTKWTGVKHHIDHIIPLKGEGVRGLNVPWNIQVISGKENGRKGINY